jgi:hypothetical protein
VFGSLVIALDVLRDRALSLGHRRCPPACPDKAAIDAAHATVLAALLPSPPAPGVEDGLRVRIALLAAFRHGWEKGAWYVSDATGGGVAAQRAAADKARRRDDSNDYVRAALAPAAPETAEEQP